MRAKTLAGRSIPSQATDLRQFGRPRSQVSRLALLSAIGIAAAAGGSLLTVDEARADCAVVPGGFACADTVTTDTQSPANAPNDRHYMDAAATPLTLTVGVGATVSGHGLAITNTGSGRVTITHDGAITVDAGAMPTQGGAAALSITAGGGPVVYSGAGGITNNGAGAGLEVIHNGAGAVEVTVDGAIASAAGSGIHVDVDSGDAVLVRTAARSGARMQESSSKTRASAS